MKLKVLNNENLPRTGTKELRPKVSFRKDGSININECAAALMNVKPGDKLSMAQDEEEKENWYFFKCELGFPLGKKDKGLTLYHKLLSARFKVECQYKETDTLVALIAGKPTIIKGDLKKYWGIIVKTKI